MAETKEKRDMLKILMDDTKSYVEAMKVAMPETAPVLEMRAQNFEDYYHSKETGKKVAWVNFATPPEIFWAMDVIPFVYDGFAAQAASAGYGLEYIDIAEQYIPDHLCSDNKIHLGLFLSGHIPAPDIMVYPSSPCDSNRTALSAVAEYAKIPQFVVDLPYFKNERSIKYIADEWKRLITVLEEITGKKLDLDKLREVMKLSNTAHELYTELDEYRKMVPCAYTSMETFLDGGCLINAAGTPQLANYYKSRSDTMKKRTASQKGTGVDEKIRLVWPYGVYVPDMDVLPWLEEKYGAVTINFMNFNWVVQPTTDLSSLDSMMAGLAKKTTLMPMNREVHGPIENFIDATKEMCIRYKADCACITGHVACKSNWAVYKLVKDILEQDLGIPLLIFEVDLFDPRITSVEDVRLKLSDWFETIVIPGMKKR